jgi:phage-related protein
VARVATTVGEITFGVGVNATDLAAELRAAVTPAIAAANRDIGKNSIKVGADSSSVRAAADAVDSATARIVAAQDKAAQSSSKLREEEGKLDNTRSVAATTAIRAMDAEDRLGSLRESGVATTSQLARAENDVATTRARADAAATSMATAEERVTRARIDSNASTRNVTAAENDLTKAHIEVASATERTATEQAKLRTEWDNAGRSSTTLGGSLAGVARSLATVGTGVGAVAGGTAAIAALGGAAGAALGAVSGLAVGMAAVGPAAAGIAATAFVGLQGIKDTFTALNAVQQNAGVEAQAQADKVTAATRQVASAQDQVTSALEAQQSANRTYIASQHDVVVAQQGVSQATQQTERDLRNLQLTAAGAALDVKEANLNLRDAQLALQQSTPQTYERNLLNVERAQLAVSQAQEHNTEVQQDNNVAQAKGVSGADKVVAAKDKVVSAQQREIDAAVGVTAANRNVAKAQADVAAAQANLAKIQAEGTPSQQKFNALLAQLAPNAQAFVLAVKDMLPAFTDLRKSVQDNLFAGLSDQFKQTATAVLPVLKEGMNGVASALNDAAVQALQFVRSAQGIDALKASFTGATDLIHGLGEGTHAATKGFTDFVAATAPAMEGIGKSIAGVADALGKIFSKSAASGQLASIFAGFADALNGAGPLLGGVVKSLLDMADKVLPTLGPFFTTLGGAIAAIGPSLGTLGAAFIKALTPILPPLAALITTLSIGLQPVLPVLSNLIQTVGAALIPIIPMLSQFVTIVGDTLIATLNVLAPALPPLATAFTSLLSAIAPLIPMIANNLAVVVEALAPALTTVFDALAPVIQAFAAGMIPVVQQLAPTLAQMAATIGNALAAALIAVAPYIPSLVTAFTNMFIALTPLLPTLVNLAVSGVPAFIDALKLLIPMIIFLMDNFTSLCNKVIVPIVIPLINELSKQFTNAFTDIQLITIFLVDGVFPKIKTVLEDMKGWFSDAVNFIGRVWAGFGNLAAAPINFVINTVWNNGLLKAWSAIDSLLGGVLPNAVPIPLIPAFATGGALKGAGTGTSDDILMWGSNNEHMVTAKEVIAAGGHDVIYAIRDMIARGVPFTWDNGQIISRLGKDNLVSYGKAIESRGVGNVPPEGLFDSLLPRFRDGGAIMPWMTQLKAGHDFARSQSGKAYQWAGPRFVGDSFDCSGFMGSIAAVILGLDPWRRYFSTGSFGGANGPMGFIPGLDSGFAIGVTNDPGGPGGGHTAGTLGSVPLLALPLPVNVESGGNLGNVHYGGGTDPRTFASQWHLPIGENGFFQPGAGGAVGGTVGPSTDEQSGFLTSTVTKMVHAITEPLRKTIQSLWSPPPADRAIPLAALDGVEGGFVRAAGDAVGHIGSGLAGAWHTAESLGSKILDFANPFDSGGIASGTGVLTKDVIAPERVLSPEQTRLFEALVTALQQVAGGAGAAGTAPQLLTNDVFSTGIQNLAQLLGAPVDTRTGPQNDPSNKVLDVAKSAVDAVGRINTNTADLAQRSESSTALVTQQQTDQINAVLTSILHSVGGDVLVPIMQSAVNAGIQVIQGWIGGIGNQITKGTDRTTSAVQNIPLALNSGNTPSTTALPAFGSPGSSFDAASAISTAVQSIAGAATSAFNKVASDISNAALAQKPSLATPNKGNLGDANNSGGPLVDMIVQITGVVIQIRDNLQDTYKAITDFKGILRGSFDSTGKIITDTAELVQRNESNVQLVVSETNRINQALIKAVLKYLILNVLLPIIQAILGAMITLATTAIGAAIGSFIPVIGTAIGAAIGAVIGAALSGLAAVFVSALAVSAGSALDSFDSGGVANGVGFLPKNTISPERVLNPRQTQSFDKLVQVLDKADLGRRNTTVNAPFTVVGGQSAGSTAHNDLLSLLNAR